MEVGLSETRTGPTLVCAGGQGCKHPRHDHSTEEVGEKEPQETPQPKRLTQPNCLSLLPKKGMAKPFEISSRGGPMTLFFISTTLSLLWEASPKSPLLLQIGLAPFCPSPTCQFSTQTLRSTGNP